VGCSLLKKKFLSLRTTYHTKYQVKISHLG